MYSQCEPLHLFPVSDMGVLMSKKQQVDKVQKCSAVVSAFKEGLKERPPPAHRAQNTAGPEENPAECSAETESSGKGQEEGQPPEQGKKGSASLEKEGDSKVNQEAWSRLRDGKGVEPEDLNKAAHQLTPPAFVRPKREANDDEPVEIVLDQREQVGKLLRK